MVFKIRKISLFFVPLFLNMFSHMVALFLELMILGEMARWTSMEYTAQKQRHFLET
jgi:hypothetical protein